MYRRRFLVGAVAGISISVLAGCLGDDSDPTREDLSTYDERGMSRYETAYELGEGYADDFNEHIEPIVTGGRTNLSGSSAFAAEDRARALTTSFNEVHEEFMAALHLSETPAFNQPCYDAARWARAHAEVCDELFVSTTTLRGVDAATSRYESALEFDAPVEPQMVLEQVLEHYS